MGYVPSSSLAIILCDYQDEVQRLEMGMETEVNQSNTPASDYLELTGS